MVGYKTLTLYPSVFSGNDDLDELESRYGKGPVTVSMQICTFFDKSLQLPRAENQNYSALIARLMGY